MDLDLVFLSRLQFSITIMFHYLFPPLTIGMGVVLMHLEAMYLWKREPIYETAAKFWTSLFAVSFAMGVATGIVMEFQFGTNWASYSRFVGDVFGSALASEGIFAFFLESGFLAVLVFGWDKVSPAFHMFATSCVAIGSMFSAIWIVVANSWQQTPAGSRIVQRMVNGVVVPRAETVDFWAVVFNPSSVIRLTHTLIGAFVLGSFFIMSVSAWYLLKRKHEEFARRSFTGGLIFATMASLAALLSGHSNARMVSENQPAKLAAFEGHFRSGPADLHLFGVPDEKEGRVKYGVAIPGGLSFLAKNDFHADVTGLDRIPRKYWPPIAIPFYSYHLMIGLGMFFIALTLLGSYLRWRGTLFTHRWLLWIFAVAVLGPFAANEVGWVSAEVGRQPWVVHPPVVKDAAGNFEFDSAGMIKMRLEEGLLTPNGVSRLVPPSHVLTSIVMFSLIYLLLFWIWLYVLNDKIQKGPKPALVDQTTTSEGLLEATASRTLHTDSMSEAKQERNDGY